MKTTKHTPGPWMAHFEGIANFRVTAIRDGEEFAPYGCNGEADARLIAAAPDLLVALEDLVSAFRNGFARDADDETRETYASSFDALIAKARGES